MVPNVVRSISMAWPPHDLGTRPRLRVGRRAWHRCQGTPASRRSPDSQTAPPRVGRLRRRRATALLAPRPIPSGTGRTKPTIQQARDRAEVLWGATRPEWVTSAGSLERLLTGARNGLAKCLVKVMSADRPRDRTAVHVVMDKAQATWPAGDLRPASAVQDAGLLR